MAARLHCLLQQSLQGSPRALWPRCLYLQSLLFSTRHAELRENRWSAGEALQDPLPEKVHPHPLDSPWRNLQPH